MADGNNLAEKKDPAIEAAKNFCKRMKVEKKLRDAIADITTKLNRSNLSAEEGKRHATLLAKAYGQLEDVEKALGKA